MILTALQYTKLFSIKKISGLLILVFCSLINFGAIPTENLSLSNPTPTASITSVTGTSPLCVAATAVYSKNGVVLDGGTGAWSSSNPSVATVDPSTGLVTAIGAGTCNIIYTITGGGGGTVLAQQPLVVNARPVPTIAGFAPVCVGATYVSYSTEGGMTGYTWTISSGGIITSGETTSTIMVTWNTAGSQNVSVNYINPNTCTPATPTVKNVAVNPLPIPTIAGNTSVCAGTTGVTYTTEDLMSGYNWTISSGGTITAGQYTKSITVTWNTAGSQTVSVNYTNGNNCTATSATPKTVTVDPAPTVIASSNAKTICSGSSANITLTSSVASTYNWTIGNITGAIAGASASTGSTINQVLTNPSSSVVGTVQYIVTPTATAGNCPGVPLTITVTVNPSPVVTTLNTATICSGSSTNIILTSSISSSFVWTVGTNFGGITGAVDGSGSTINQVLTNPLSASAGSIEYIVTPTAGLCAGAPYSIVVTVNPAPNVTTFATPAICSGSSTNINLTASTPSSYSWTIGTNTGSISGATPGGSGTAINQVLTNPNTVTAGSVVYSIIPVSTVGSCTGSPYPITVTVNPAPIVTNTLTASTCSGSSPSIALSASISSSFSWTIGTNIGNITGASPNSGNTINQTLTNPSNSTVGSIQYMVTPASSANSCPGTPSTITVSVNPTPVVMTGNTSTVCSGSSTNIGLTSSTPSTFTWTFGNVSAGISGASIGSGNAISQVLTNTSTSVSGTVDYIVTPTSITGSCVGSPYTITVTVNPSPAIITPITKTICSGTNPNISLAATIQSNYSWTIGTITGGILGASNSAGSSLINQTLTSPSSPTGGSVPYIVTPTSTSGGCVGSPSTITVTVTPTPTVTNAPAVSICNGSSTNIALIASAPSSFSWIIGTVTGGISGYSADSGATINQTLTNSSNTSAGTIEYIVTPIATTGGCSGSPFTITVTVNPTPIVTTANTATVCSTDSPDIVLAASTSSTFSWTVGAISGSITGASSGNASTISQILTNPSNTTPGTVQYLVTPTSIAGNCVGSPYTITVTVNPSPVLTSSATAAICSGQSPNLTLTASESSTFTWTVGTVSGGITGSSSGAGTPLNQTLYNPSHISAGSVQYLVVPTSDTNGSCAVFPVVVTVNPTPEVTNTSAYTICSGSSTNISLTSSVPSTFSWTSVVISGGITGAAASGSGPSITEILTNPSALTSGTVEFIVTPTSSTDLCTGTPFSIIVTVNPGPSVTNALTSSVCSGSSTNIVLQATAPSSFAWTIGGITGSITGAIPGSGPTISQTLTNPSGTNSGTVEYIVTPTATNGLCVGPSKTITVTVNPAPTVTTSNTATICSGATTSISLTSSTPSGFIWTVGAISGGITGATAGSGTSISQTLTNPSNSIIGTVTYTVTPTATTGSCIGTPYSIVVTVNPKPSLTNSPITICSGSNTNIVLGASISSTYTWTLGPITGGVTNAATGSGPTINQVLTYPGNSSFGTVPYVVTPTSAPGGCAGIPTTISVTVNAVPVVTTSDTKTICSGTSTNIDLTSSAASTYIWSIGTITGGITGASPSGGSTINQVLTNPSSTATGTVQYDVTPTSTSGSCAGSPFTITVTVNPSPVVTTLNTATICNGTSPNISLIASVPSTFTWTVGANPGSITGASANSGATINQVLTNPSNSTAAVIEYIVTPTAITGLCAGNPYSIFVTVRPTPIVTTSPASTTICSLTSPNIVLTASAPSSFAWTLGPITGAITGASAGSGSSINQILTNPNSSSAGTVPYIVTPTSSVGSCAGTPLTINVTVNPIPVVTTANTATICSGTTTNIALTATASSDFTWAIGTITGGITGANAGSGDFINQTLTNPSSTTLGTVQYLVTPTSKAGLCSGTLYIITVTVNPSPVVTTVNTKTICSGTNTNIVLNASSTSSFTWTIGAVSGSSITGAIAGSGTTISQVLTNPSNTALGTVEYLVTPIATTSLCPGTPYSIVVTVNPTPIVTNQPTASICSGSSTNIVLTSSTPSTFAWTVVSVTGGITGSIDDSGSTISQVLTNPSSTTVGTVVYNVTPTSVSNSCPGTPSTITVTVLPTPSVTSSLTASICSGSSSNITLSASTSSSFSWTIGNITGSISGAIAGSGSAINQILTNPSNSSSGTVEYISTPTSGTGTCIGASATIVVTVNPTPVITNQPAKTICTGASTNITLASSVASTYTWIIGTITGGITGATSNSGAAINQTLTNPGNSTAGTVEYIITPTAMANSCSGTPFTITVTVNPTPIITNPVTANSCSGTSPNIVLAATAPSSFAWVRGAITGGITGAALSGSGPVINDLLTNPSNTVAGTVEYIVTPTSTSGSCAGTPHTITVTVNPSVTITSSNTATVCSGSSTNISLGASAPSSFAWVTGANTGGITGASAGSGGTINQTLINPSNVPASIEYIVTPVSTLGNCTGVPFTITVNVDPAPIVTTASTKTICSGSGTNISLTASMASTFTWTVGTITGSVTGANAGTGASINQTLTNPGSALPGTVEYIITPTATTASCPGIPYSIVVTVNPKPLVTNAITASMCSGTSPAIALSASVPSNFAWTIGAVTGTISGSGADLGPTINQVLTNTSNATSGTVAYVVTPTSTGGSCVGNPLTITVTVNPIPVVTTTNAVTICSGASPNITLAASTQSNFTWTIGTISGSITGASAGSGSTINQVLTNPSTTAVGSVEYLVTPTSATGSCAGTPYAITVTVNPAPNVTNPATKTICNGTSTNIALTASVPSSFTWIIGTTSGGITGASPGSGGTIDQTLTNPSNLTVGTVEYIVTPTATTGSCVGTPYSIVVTVNPNLIITNLPTAIVCSGMSPNIVLTASMQSTFSWTIGAVTGNITGATPSSGASINQILTNSSSTIAGTVQYIITPTSTLLSCVGTPHTITVTVNPSPVVTNPNSVAICSGASPNISLTSSIPSSFTWTVGTISGGIAGVSAGTGAIINQILTNPSNTTAGSVVYIVIPTTSTGNCSGAAYSITVMVNPAPTVLTPNTKTICSGSGTNISLTASMTSTFAWTVGQVTGGITGANAGIGATINQTLINPGSASAGTVEYIVTPTETTGVCAGTPYSIVITVNPKPIVTNAFTASMCSGTSPAIALTSSVPGSFAWTVGPITGLISGSSDDSGPMINQVLTNPSNASAGTVAYIVTPTSAGGSCVGTPQTITVTVNPIPAVTTPNIAEICSGTSPNINLTASSPSNYTWTIGAISGSIITGESAGSGSIINQVLTNPSTTIAGTIVYLVTPTSVAGSCAGTPYTITVTVNPAPNVTNPATKTICSGTSTNIALTASVPSSFIWTIGNISGGITGASSGSGGTIDQTLTNPSNLTVGTVEYIVTPTVSIGSCGGTPFKITVTVNPNPIVNNSPTAVTCSGTSPNIVLTASVPSSFTWIIGSITGGITGASASSGASINQTLTNPSSTVTGTVQYIVTPTSTSQSCVGIPYTITVTVNPAPVVTNPNSVAICSGTSPNIGLTASIPSSFTWTVGTITGGITGASAGSGGLINQTLTNPSNSAAGSVVYNVTPTTSTGNCVGSAYSITVMINPASSIITPNTKTICSGSGTNISLTASAPSSFTWVIGTITGGITGANAGIGATINQTLVNPGSASAGIVEYIVTPTATTGTCPGTPYSIVVTVNPIPVMVTAYTMSVCSGSSSNISLTASTASTFIWTVGAITGGITGANDGLGSTINQILTNPSDVTSGTVTYIVVPTATNGTCPGAPYSIIVTVYPSTHLTSALTLNVCSDSPINYIPVSSAIGTTHQWNRSTIAGISNGAATGTGNINETLTNTSTSPINVNYVFRLTFGGCTTTENVVVTVNPKPILTSTLSAPAICNHTAFIYTPSTLTTGAAFTWQRLVVSGISQAQSNGVNLINEILDNTTTAPITVTYSYTITVNGCSNSQNVTVDVKPTPVLTSGLTPSSICSNTLFTYTPQSSTQGTLFAWNRSAVTGISNPTASGFGNPNETLINTTNSPAVVTYVYSLSADGCSNPTTYNVSVTVNPAPSLSSSLSPAGVCSGTIFNYPATSSTSGAVMTWIRPLVAGIAQPASNGSGNINEILTNSTVLPVNVTYQYTIYANGCTTNQNVIVTVNPVPALSSSLIPSPLCSGNSFVYNATSLTPSTTFSWTRLFNTNIAEPATTGTSSAINETLTNSTSASVNVTYTYTLTANGCSNPSTFDVVVTVNPKPAVPVISPTSPVSFCAGGSVVLTSTSSNSYQWSTGEVTQSITVSTSGSYFVIVKDANGCQSTQSSAVTVNSLALPSVFAGTDDKVCAGSIFAVSGAKVLNESSFAWSTSGTGKFDNPATLNPTYEPSVLDQTTGTVSLILTASSKAPCTASISDVLLLTIQPRPTANAGRDTTLCYPNSLVITGATASNYQTLVWSHDGTGVLSGLNTLKPTYIPGAGDAGKTVRLKLTANSINPCNVTSFNEMDIVVGSMPGDPGVITGPGGITGSAIVCKPSSSPLVFSILPIAGVTTYNWNLPPGATLVSGGNTNIIRVSFPSGSLSGDLTVYGTNGCGNGPISTLPIQVNDLPANPGSITGTSPVCQGKTGVIYTIAPVTGAISYFWTVPTGAIITNTSTDGTSITVDFGGSSTTGNVKVYAKNACGSGPTASKAITINPKPSTPVISATGSLTFCEGGSVMLNGPVLGNGYNYLWNPGGATTQNNLVTAGGNYHLTVTNSATGCSSDPSDSTRVIVNPAPAAPVSIGYMSICWDGTGTPPLLDANLVTTVPSTSTLKWYDAPTAGNVVVNPTLNVPGAINSKTYYAEATEISTGCKSLIRTPVKLTIVQVPDTPVNGPDQIVCQQSPIQTLTATTSTAPPAGTTILWFLTPTGGAPVTPTLNTVGTKTYYAEANNGTCSSLTRSPGVTLTILAAPAAPISGGNINQCIDNLTNNSYTATATVPAGSSVTWYNQAAGGSIVVPSLPSNIANSVTFYAESKDNTTNCTSITRTAVTITVVDHPAAPTTPGDQSGCQRATALTLTATATAAAGSTLRWFNVASGGTPITGAANLTTVGTITYYAESYIAASSCASLTRTPVKLTINPAPAVPTSLGNITQCALSPQIQTLTAQATAPAGSILSWYTTATGGTPVTPATWDQVGAMSYYAESVDNAGCASTTRTRVILTINPTPDAPLPGTPSADDPNVGEVRQCEQTPIQTLTATATLPPTAPTGTTIRWYTTPTGGTPLAANAQIRRTVGTSTFYAESYIATGTCPSLTRTKVVLTIDPAPVAPVSKGNITKCAETPVVPLNANNALVPVPGVTFEWFTTLTGGEVVLDPVLSDIGNIIYYAEAVSSSSPCRSLRRTAVTLTIRDASAPLDSIKNIIECAKSPIQRLTATAIASDGSTIKWYNAAVAGSLVTTPTLASVGTVTYWAEGVKGACTTTQRMPVILTINAAPSQPVSKGNLTKCAETLTAVVPLDANNQITPIQGIGIEWFNSLTGGDVVATPTIADAGTVTYFAEAKNLITDCRSTKRTPVILTINASPAPLDSLKNITECAAYPILQTLTATAVTTDGSLIRWFTQPAGGTALPRATLNAIRSTIFYAEAYKGTCVSPSRMPVTLTINGLPAIPVSRGNLIVCANDTLIQTLDANTRIATPLPANTGLEWFTTATGGTPVSPTLNAVGTATYYAEAKDINTECRSSRRTAITLTINETPAPPVSDGPITQCVGKTIQTITAKVTAAPGVTVTWYSAATGGNIVTFPILNTIGTKSYYAEARLGTCISRRTKVTLAINPLPANPIYSGTINGVIAPICEPDSVDASKWAKSGAPGSKLLWYDALTLGNLASPIQKAPATRIVYAESVDTISGCAASRRIPITMTVNSQAPPALAAKYPLGVIKECAKSPVQTLNARNALNITAGLTLKWYDQPTGGTALLTLPTLSTVNDSIIYYAAYLKPGPGGCESITRTAVKLSITAPLASASSNSPLALGQDLKLFGGPVGNSYTYLWIDPRKFTYTGMDQVIQSVTASMGGMYKLTVTDSSGCSSSDSTKVYVNTAKVSFQPTCIGGILYLSGWPDNGSYLWTGPNNFSSIQQSPSINNVTTAMAGRYKLQFIDSSGATSADSINVTFKSLPVPIISVSTLCPAGTMQLNGNPSGMVSYLWTGPGGGSIATDPKNPKNSLPMPYPLPADSVRYTLTIKDQNGCEASTSIIPIPFSPKATYNTPLCSGDTLRLRGEPSGMASYSWTDPTGKPIATTQSPSIKNVQVPGIYTLTVKNLSTINTCTWTTTVDVKFSSPVVKPVITASPNPACQGGDLTLQSSPSGMATYEWSGPTGWTSTDQNPATIINFQPSNAGVYNLKVTNGCTSYATPVTVGINSVTFTGTYGPYCTTDSKVTILASPSGGVFNGNGMKLNVFDPAAAGVGQHLIQYTYNNGKCDVLGTYTIEVFVKPNIVVNPSALILKSCTGTTSDLTLPAVTAGSSNGLTLTYWRDSKATVLLTTPKAVTAGTYYIKGTSRTGKCFDVQSAFVSQPDSLRATLVPSADLSCAGDTTGTMTVNVTLGTAPFNYLWSTIPPQNTVTAKNLKAGIYTVVVTDAKKCIASFTGEIKEPPPIRLGFSVKPVQCMSDENGSASVDTINGSTDVAILNSYKYKWSTNPIQTTREALRLSPLWHRITVTDPNSCSRKDSVFISVSDTMRPSITCPKDINMTVAYLKTSDFDPNKYIVDLGKPLFWDNCTVIDTMVLNDAPVKFRTGETLVKWTVTDQMGLINSCIQKVYVKEIPSIPQMISPNGDGLNDKFIIDGLTAKEYYKSQLLIFTRSGQLVFQNDNYEDPANAWDGKYTESTFSKNQLVAPGVYYYILKLGGTSQTLRGYVYVYY